MDSDTALLTIAIPTYNRPEKLLKQIGIIIPQLTKEVCLVIRDNHSDSSVIDIIPLEFIDYLSVVRNKMNIGADANIARCFEECTTDWLWTVSDDDFLTEDAVSIVIDYIHSYSNAVFINLNAHKDVTSEGFYNYARELQTHQYLGDAICITKCIYNVRSLSSSLAIYYQYLSLMMGHLFYVLQYLKAHPKEICITSSTAIIQHTDEFNDISWNEIEYVKRINSLFEYFAYEDKKFLQKNLLKAVSTVIYNYLRINSHKLNKSELLYYICLIIFKQGIYNTLRYNFINLLAVVSYLLLPRGVAIKLKDIYKSSQKMFRRFTFSNRLNLWLLQK